MMRRSVFRATFLCLLAGVPATTWAQAINWQDGFAPVVERVMPSVVSIYIETPRGAVGAGSGFVIASDGLIATNLHVVENAARVQVRLADRRKFWAKSVGYDAETDLSVIKIDAKGLTPITWGDSSKVRVGEFAIALGNPRGLGPSVSVGIVSAVERRDRGEFGFLDYVQTDAAVNPGNSGGPLTNARGEVIGVNRMIASQSGGSEGIGFAISSNLARSVVEQLAKGKHVARGFLGVAFADTEDSGAVVARVVAKSPAAAAGLRLGDVVVAINGRSIYDSTEARLHIAQARPGTEVVLAVLRKGARQELRAKLVPRPDR
jgi:S1-C subfamily serine protease